MTLPFAARLRDENAKYKAQLKTASGQCVCVGRLTVVKTEHSYSLESTTWPEAFNLQDAEQARRVYPDAKIVPAKKLLKDRIAQNDKVLKSFK